MSDPILAIDWRSRFRALNAGSDRACDHQTWDFARVQVRSGAEHVQRLCLDCYEFFGEKVRKVNAPPLEKMRLVTAEKYDEYHANQRDRERQGGRQAFFDLYDRYLESPVWAGRRAMVLKRADGICEGCLSRPATMVHHLTYEHVGDELLFELRAICARCHDKCHEDHE